MQTINENSGLEVKARFYAEPGGVLVRPDTAEWRVTSENGGRVYQDWTSADIEVEFDGEALSDSYALIEIPGSVNTCSAGGNYTLMRLTVAADRGTDREYSQVLVYRVLRSR